MLATRIRGTMAVMKPEFWSLSPSIGVLAGIGCLSRNLAEYPKHLATAESTLARELFLSVGGKLKATTTQSKPGCHINSRAWGSMIGLAISNAVDPNEIKTVLVDHHQIPIRPSRSDKSRSYSYPPPSFGRYSRVVGLINDVIYSNHRLGTTLISHFTWEKIRSKEDCLQYLLELHSRAPQPVLRPEAQNPEWQKSWLEEAFTEEQLTDETMVEAAALRLLEEGTDCTSWASDFELVAASLSMVHAYRSPIQVEKFQYASGKEVPDCVEVCVREILEMLLFQRHRGLFDISLLPSTCQPALVNFFTSYNDKLNIGILDDIDRIEVCRDWFNLCQNLPGGEIAINSTSSRSDQPFEYVRRAPSGELYELKPTMATMARTLQQLLLGSKCGVGHWKSLEDFAKFWNVSHPYLHIALSEKRVVERSAFSEGVKHLEIASLYQDASGLGMNIELNPSHNIATCRHHQRKPTWASEGAEVHTRHLRRSLNGSYRRSPKDDALALLWPTLLGDARLEAIATGMHHMANPRQVVEAIVAADYQPRQIANDLSGFIVAQPTLREAALEQSALERKVMHAIELAAKHTSNSPSCHDEDERMTIEMASNCLSWLLFCNASKDISTWELARRMKSLTPEILQSGGSLEVSMSQRNKDGDLLANMVGYASGSKPIVVESFRGLGAVQMLKMARFLWDCSRDGK